jgi:hypothetical protein
MTSKASYALLGTVVFLACARFVAVGTAKPYEGAATVSIHGTDYTVIDRVEYSAYPAEFGKPVSAFKSYQPGEACATSAEPPREPSLEWLLRIPDAKASGFAIAPLQLHVFKHQVLGPQFERGAVEIAVYNPCLDPIAVPVLQTGNLSGISLQENASPIINPMAFYFLIADNHGDTVLDTSLVLSASAGRPESYRVLRQNEAVILLAHFQISPFTMSRPDFLGIARNLNMTAMYWAVSIGSDGTQTPVMSTGTNGSRIPENYVVPYDLPPVRVEIDK